MKRTLHLACVLLILCVLGGHARADVIPPDVAACQGKQAGDSCDAGRCRESTCTRIDYSQRDCGVPDAGTPEGGLPPADASVGGLDASTWCPPGSTSYACLKCQAGGGDTDAAVNGDAGTSHDKDDDGGCAVSTSGVRAQLVALLFAGTFAAFVSRQRRR